MAEVPGSRLLSKRPRGYVPDDVAARRRVDGLGQEWEEEGAAHAPAPLGGTESVVAAALAAEAAAKASRQGHKGGVKPAKDKKSVSFAHEDEDELPTVSAAPLRHTRASRAPPARRTRLKKRPLRGRCSVAAQSVRSRTASETETLTPTRSLCRHRRHGAAGRLLHPGCRGARSVRGRRGGGSVRAVQPGRGARGRSLRRGWALRRGRWRC